MRLTPKLTPHGKLLLVPDDEAAEVESAVGSRLLESFGRSAGHGLLRLGGAEVGQPLPPALVYWREFAGIYLTGLCTMPEVERERASVSLPTAAILAELVLSAPLMPGAEYLTREVLCSLWEELGQAFEVEWDESRAETLAVFLKTLAPVWNVVGRVHFNLAENRKDADCPFAFLATYTPKVSAQGKVQHQPLGAALREYSGAANKDQLLSLLLPVQRAAESCPWLRRMIDEGEIFHPLRWSAEEAVQFLGDAPALERAGVVLRMPATWRAGRPSRPKVTATVGGSPPSALGRDALLDFSVELSLDGEVLSAAEVKALLASSSGLSLIRGQWVEVDTERLAATLQRFEEAQRLASDGGLSFGEAMRLLAGAGIAKGENADPNVAEWSQVTAGRWLAETLRALRSPEGLAAVDPGPALRGELREYQQVGLRWLHLLSRLGLGACLADDMGLGKTIQVLSMLLVQRGETRSPRRPTLLVAPASILSNWVAEHQRFAPSLEVFVAHPSALPAAELKQLDWERLSRYDLVLTTYGTVTRLPVFFAGQWSHVILDEAQAIKNPGAKQTKAVKKLQGHSRIALTGTPVENRLGDLWSIFDFINPGLLGSDTEFTGYAKRLTSVSHNPYGPLRELVRPYILRRLKTDKTVISDLPDKTELKAYCSLSRKQAALYQQAVEELSNELAQASGMQRRGLVLSFLMRFKQLCNHPSQWLGDGGYSERDSGKWARLRELAEVIAAKQEKALVFTQFRELCAPLGSFLASVFGRPGLVLHGDTPVQKRGELVRRFQGDESVPFFVLSLKAGGTGLNLTAASHVVHFDRWWNPAVENQATDRAFRIGQTKNVLVHKFICKGTVEEKIDTLIDGKKKLSQALLEGGAEINLTELDDAELIRLVALDLKAAMEEG
ncbi:MAG: DEAD/DEAH box helicase [Myxococcota bacterium]|jgi:non-specific serine/threonine protein kinase|nr:DEAD/DEAH box helicase [Myxococcota bacterium]